MSDASPPYETDVSYPLDDFQKRCPVLPTDPALVAARRLLTRSLQICGTTFEEAGRDGAVVFILVPVVGWSEPVRDAWKSIARRGQFFSDSPHDRVAEKDVWVLWAPAAAERRIMLDEAAGRFARCISKGKHCVGVAPDPDWLPSDLVLAADYRLVLPPLTAADVALIAQELCGAVPSVALSDEEAASVTPRHLQLARRLDQSADTYICKLRSLLEREIVPAVFVEMSSPRDKPNLGRVHGMDEAVAWGLTLARDIRAFQEGTLPWSDIDRGCLVSGPPGCGKTMFARALATTCGIPLVCGSYSQWHGSGSAHQGSLLKAMRETFYDARSSAPAIVFIDEIDSFPDRAAVDRHNSDWETQVVNGLLAEIDGVGGREGVVVLGACNNADRLDPALIRSGRLDRHIRIGMPNRAALVSIFREHLGSELSGVDLSTAALAAGGCTGADCERHVRGARRRARLSGREMSLSELIDEIDGVDGRTTEDLWVMAVHESGHVTAASLLDPGSIESVSLRAQPGAGGFTKSVKRKSVFLRAADVQRQLMMLLAGRAAEEEIIGAPSSGAGGQAGCDLALATTLAVQASAALGLDEANGLVWWGIPQPHMVTHALAANPALCLRIREQLDDAYAAARSLLAPRLDGVRALAEQLVARRVLDGAEAEAIVRRKSPQFDEDVERPASRKRNRKHG